MSADTQDLIIAYAILVIVGGLSSLILLSAFLGPAPKDMWKDKDSLLDNDYYP